MPKVLSHNRQLFAEHIIIKHQLREAQQIICKRKEHKQKQINVLKGRTIVSVPEVLEELKKCKV